jgi:hypothetical protein
MKITVRNIQVTFLIRTDKIFYFFYGTTSRLGQRFLMIVASRSHSEKPQSLRLLWTMDRPVAETSTWQQTTIKRDRHPCCRLDLKPQPQQASGPRPTP